MRVQVDVAVGSVSLARQRLLITIARVAAPDLPDLTVTTSGPHPVRPLLARRGDALVAALPWERTDLPDAFAFEISEPSDPPAR